MLISSHLSVEAKKILSFGVGIFILSTQCKVHITMVKLHGKLFNFYTVVFSLN